MITSRHCMNSILAAVVSANLAPAGAFAKDAAKTPAAQEKSKAAVKKPTHAMAKPAGDAAKSDAGAAAAGAAADPK